MVETLTVHSALPIKSIFITREQIDEMLCCQIESDATEFSAFFQRQKNKKCDLALLAKRRRFTDLQSEIRQRWKRALLIDKTSGCPSNIGLCRIVVSHEYEYCLSTLPNRSENYQKYPIQIKRKCTIWQHGTSDVRLNGFSYTPSQQNP